MKIYGLDFTSAPSLKKPITYTQCRLDEDGLFLESPGCLKSFAEFKTFLSQSGPWIAGMDFPFGQPRMLIENIGWPQTWKDYVNLVSKMTRLQFVDVLTEYCKSRKAGDKHHLRRTDKLANAQSPMMLYRVPVAKMFFEGAPRLLKAGSVFWRAMQELTRASLLKPIQHWSLVAGLGTAVIKTMLRRDKH